jgi:hypothetical protein
MKLLTTEMIGRWAAWQLRNAFDIRAVGVLEGRLTYAIGLGSGHCRDRMRPSRSQKDRSKGHYTKAFTHSYTAEYHPKSIAEVAEHDDSHAKRKTTGYRGRRAAD